MQEYDGQHNGTKRTKIAEGITIGAWSPFSKTAKLVLSAQTV
jgi:hypothetical protein